MKSVSLENIIEEMDKYLVIDPMDKNLDQISLRTGRAFSKAQDFYIPATRNLALLQRKKHSLELHLREYYLGEANPQSYEKRPLARRVLKTDVDMYIKADDLYQEINELLEEQKRIIKYLEQCFDRIRSMSYDIRNAIDWRKYRDGN